MYGRLSLRAWPTMSVLRRRPSDIKGRRKTFEGLVLILWMAAVGIIGQTGLCTSTAVADLPSDFLNVSTDSSDVTEPSSSSGKHQRDLDEKDEHHPDYWHLGSMVLPSFDNTTARNVTAQQGQTGYLHCIVKNLGDKTVSWIRRRDFHVLTVGLETYTSDERFQVIHMERTDDWTLQIKFSQLKDAGIYECQVSSDPKISYFVNFTVVVPEATIEGSPELYIKTGSSINLTCIITHSPELPVFVFWYVNTRLINYADRGEIVVQKAAGDTAISRLYISDAKSSDSGNYTCGPSNAEPTSIIVHVLNGEKPAAMQHDGKPSPSGSSSLVSLPRCLFLLLSVLHLGVR